MTDLQDEFRGEAVAILQDDAYAASFQTLGQYRSAVIKALQAKPAAHTPEGLHAAVERTIGTIERQLALIAERAPGTMLDKQPVVRSLSAHKRRLKQALISAPPSLSEWAPNSAKEFVIAVCNTFKKDIDSGYVTNDKKFAVELLSQALMRWASYPRGETHAEWFARWWPTRHQGNGEEPRYRSLTREVWKAAIASKHSAPACDAQADERGAGAPEPEVLKVIDELYEEATERLKEDRNAGVLADTQTADLLTEWAGRLELTETAFYEDVYGQLTEMLEPHVQREGTNPNGTLPASVVESMSILLESWQARAAAPQPAFEAVQAVLRKVDPKWRERGEFGVKPHEQAIAAIRDLAAAAPQAAPVNGIPATLRHDEGAIARCSYCGRYSIDPKTLSDRQPACDCGERHGWSGSFEKPGRDAKWNGEAPTTAPQAEAAQGVPAIPVELSGVKDVIETGDGFWRSCSGCHETNEGCETGHYPYSTHLKCVLGAGCSECGGIGAVWDNTDYDALAAAGDADEIARENAAPSPDREQVGEAAEGCTPEFLDAAIAQMNGLLDTFENDSNAEARKEARSAIHMFYQRALMTGIVKCSDCGGTPSYFSSVRRCTAKDASPSPECGDRQGAALSAALRAKRDEYESKRQVEKNPHLERIYLGMRDAFDISALLSEKAASAPTLGETNQTHQYPLTEDIIKQVGSLHGYRHDDRIVFYGDSFTDFAEALVKHVSPPENSAPAVAQPLTDAPPRLWSDVLSALRRTGVEWKNAGWVFPSDDVLHNFAHALLAKGE